MRSKGLRSTTVLIFGLSLSALVCAQPARAADNEYDGDWHFTLTPYVWLPGVSGDLRYKAPRGFSGNAEVHVGAEDIFEDLKFAFMGTGSVRRGNWSVFTDFIYLDLGSDNAKVKDIVGPGGIVEFPVSLSTKSGLDGFVWTAAAAYSFFHDNVSSADAFVGFRGLGLSSSLDWQFANPPLLFPQSGHLEQYQQLWDGLIGVRGRFGFSGSHWFIPYYADIGTGQSNFTAQALAGAGYAFSWGDLSLVYRYLYYEPGQDKLINNMSVHGPAFGATFHF